MEKNNKLRILFIGNSHTYYNDMPAMVRRRFVEEDGLDCEVTMIAHGGWFLAQHVEEPDVSFNIRHGHYDYVVLQEHAHPFGPEEKFFDAARTLADWAKEAGSTPVIYMTWAKKDEPEVQQRMTDAHRNARAIRTLKCTTRTARTPPRPGPSSLLSISGVRSARIIQHEVDHLSGIII